MESNIH